MYQAQEQYEAEDKQESVGSNYLVGHIDYGEPRSGWRVLCIKSEDHVY